jgi:hypothetical protein
MADAIKMGTILIREGALLPTGVPVERDVFLPGWRLVKNLERDGLDQKFHEAGCTFFSLADEIGATVFGLTNKRRSAEQSSKSWQKGSLRNLTPWKSCEWTGRPRNVSWE